MTLYDIFTIIITITVAIAYINHRFIKMQPTIAMMFAALLISLAVIILSSFFGLRGFETQIQGLLARLDFHSLLLNGMLSFLLFAGSLTVDLNDFLSQKWEIATLASVGTIVSTILIALLMYYFLIVVSLPLPFIYCLFFGALISPTDPIAVLAMCKEVNAPRKLSVSIAGESLFNDGVGIVIFVSLYQLAFGGHPITFSSLILLFSREAIGGMAYGILLGLFCYWLMKPINDYKIQVLITLAITTGGYLLARSIDVSGPLAMVVAGIFLGNTGKRFKMSKKMSEHLFTFWELIDEIMNALLFLLIGFELLLIPFDHQHIVAGLVAIPVVLLVRFLVVGVPISVFKIWRNYSPHVIKIMSWGGLRGGLAVALALSLPKSSERGLIVAMTYAVVLFSLLIQGTTIKALVRKSKASSPKIS